MWGLAKRNAALQAQAKASDKARHDVEVKLAASEEALAQRSNCCALLQQQLRTVIAQVSKCFCCEPAHDSVFLGSVRAQAAHTFAAGYHLSPQLLLSLAELQLSLQQLMLVPWLQAQVPCAPSQQFGFENKPQLPPKMPDARLIPAPPLAAKPEPTDDVSLFCICPVLCQACLLQ